MKFEKFSQPVGNEFNRFYWAAQVLKMHQIVSVGSHSFGLGIERRLFI